MTWVTEHNRPQLLALAKDLEAIGQNKQMAPDPSFGLCHNLFRLTRIHCNFYDALPILESVFKKFFKRWKHYSGDPQYPIPHNTLTPQEAYKNEQLWLPPPWSCNGTKGEKFDYMKLRHSLCTDFAKHLRELASKGVRNEN